MNFLFNTPYIIRVLISLFSILIVNRFIKQLSLSVLVGILILAFWSGHSINTILSLSWSHFISANNLFLIIIIIQIIWLSSQMAVTGTMKELVSGIRSRLSQRASFPHGSTSSEYSGDCWRTPPTGPAAPRRTGWFSIIPCPALSLSWRGD